MLSDFPIMLRGLTYYAQILNEKCAFKPRNVLINAGALQMVVQPDIFFKLVSQGGNLIVTFLFL